MYHGRGDAKTLYAAILTVFVPASALQDNLERIDRILLVSVISLIVFLTVMLLAQVRVGLAPLLRLTRAVAAERQIKPVIRLA